MTKVSEFLETNIFGTNYDITLYFLSKANPFYINLLFIDKYTYQYKH